MKKYIISIISVILIVVIAFSATAGKAEVGALTEDERMLSTSMSYIYKEAGAIVLSLPYASINLTQTAMTKVFSGEKAAALTYLNERTDTSLQACYNLMDEICVNFKKLLDKYSVLQSSSEYAKYSALCNMFTSLKSSSTELIKRTRTFINGSGSTNDSYYTAYAEQLSDISSKIDEYGTTIDNEYNSIMQKLLGADYFVVQTAYSKGNA